MSEKSIPQIIAGWSSVADEIGEWLDGDGLQARDAARAANLPKVAAEHALVYGIAMGLRLAVGGLGGTPAPEWLADLATRLDAATDAGRMAVQ